MSFEIPLTRGFVETWGEVIDRDFFTFKDRMEPGMRTAMFLHFGLSRWEGDMSFNPADLAEDIGMMFGHYSGEFPLCGHPDPTCSRCGRYVE